MKLIIVTNLKLHTFLKHAGCPRGEGESPNSDNDGQGGEGVKNLTFRRTSFVNGPLLAQKNPTVLLICENEVQ